MTADDEPLRLRSAVPPAEGGPDTPLRLRHAVPADEGQEEAPPIEVHAGSPPPPDPGLPSDPAPRSDPAGWAGALREARRAPATAWVVAPPDDVQWTGVDPGRVRALAADIGRPGVPVSLRAHADLPGEGVGTGHWHRHAKRLAGAVDRCRLAVAEVPPGAVRAELDRLLHIVELRAGRYLRIVEVGQAVAPDDDTTLADGTAPGERPTLDGAAAEIEQRLADAVDHLAGVALAVEQIALATSGATSADGLPERLAGLFATMPDA